MELYNLMKRQEALWATARARLDAEAQPPARVRA